MPPVGFERTISAGERPQTYALDRAATGIGGNCNDLSECHPVFICMHELCELVRELNSNFVYALCIYFM